MGYNYKIFDGEKSVDLDSLKGWTSSGDNTYGPRGSHYSKVSIVNRCVNIRAAKTAALPWSIVDVKTKKSVYNSDRGKLPDELKFMKNFKRHLYLVEASLCIFSTAYLYKIGMGNDLIGLQWMQSNSVQPDWDQTLGLTGFSRFLAVDGKIPDRRLPIDKVCYITLPNPMSETMPATSPVATICNEAEVIIAINTFASNFIERGAVKATILQVEQSSTPEARRQLKDWWSRVASGIKNAWTTEVVSSAVTPVIIGEGLKEVSEIEVSMKKSESIATAMGVPHSLLFGDSANYATSGVDVQSFYHNTLLPDANLVEEELNEKIFFDRDLYFQFDIERIHELNGDNVREATAFKIFVESGVKPSVASTLAGVTLPDQITPEQLDIDYKEFQQQKVEAAIASKPQQASQDGISSGEQARKVNSYENKKQPLKDADAAKFYKWARRRITDEKSFSIDDFESQYLSRDDKETILEEINGGAE